MLQKARGEREIIVENQNSLLRYMCASMQGLTWVEGIVRYANVQKAFENASLKNL